MTQTDTNIISNVRHAAIIQVSSLYVGDKSIGQIKEFFESIGMDYLIITEKVELTLVKKEPKPCWP